MNSIARQWLLIACGGLMSACVSLAPDSTDRALADTHWELVSIQSMDEAQGTTRIAEPARFTLSFGTEGRAALRLDCNRGTAAWQAKPAVDGRSGSLRFGPLASTRALCPPPQIGERIARDLSYVRSYMLRDGRLFISLMADGGIYEWTRASRP